MVTRNKKECSNDLGQLVIKHFLNSDSEREIAKKVLIPRDSVHYIIAKYKSTKVHRKFKGSTSKTKDKYLHGRLLQRKVKTNRRRSAASVKIELENELKVIISESMVHRGLYEVGLYGRIARRKSYVNRIKRLKRLNYAKKISSEAFRILK